MVTEASVTGDITTSYKLFQTFNSIFETLKPIATALILSSLTVVFIRSDIADQMNNEHAVRVFHTHRSPTNYGNFIHLSESLVNAIILIGLMAMFSCLVAFLYWLRCTKLSVVCLMVSSTIILAFTGGLLWLSVLISFQWPCDVFTFAFVLYNFAAVGIMAIFYQKGIPISWTKGYLIASSVIISWQLSSVDVWTIWSLLGVLVAGDISTFLCRSRSGAQPSSESEEIPLPGMMYETQVKSTVESPSMISELDELEMICHTGGEGLTNTLTHPAGLRAPDVGLVRHNNSMTALSGGNAVNEGRISGSGNGVGRGRSTASRLNLRTLNPMVLSSMSCGPSLDGSSSNSHTSSNVDTDADLDKSILAALRHRIAESQALAQARASMAHFTRPPVPYPSYSPSLTATSGTIELPHRPSRVGAGQLSVNTSRMNTSSSMLNPISPDPSWFSGAFTSFQGFNSLFGNRSNALPAHGGLLRHAIASLQAEHPNYHRVSTQAVEDEDYYIPTDDDEDMSILHNSFDIIMNVTSTLQQTYDTQVQHRKLPSPNNRAPPEYRSLSPMDTIEENTVPVEGSDNDEAADTDDAGSVGCQESSLKLGIGDFVFYNVLVSRAALQGFTTFIICYVAILGGLLVTLLILSQLKNTDALVLPALPISITLGMLMYFFSLVVIDPMLDILVLIPIYV